MNASTEQLAIPSSARCVGCGYLLYQLTIDRCPECGRQFDRHVPLSMGIRPKRKSWIVKRMQQPDSQVIVALPWLLTVMILAAPMVTSASGWIIPLSCLVWIILYAEHLPTMLMRRYLAKKGDIDTGRIRSDNRILGRMTAWLSASLVLLFTPLMGFFVFLFFHSDLYALAQRVPMTPVSYWDFGSARIGPFLPDAIDRTPHELAVGILPPAPKEQWRPWASGIVFILEDDPGYHYNNNFRWHLSGNWYLEYRPRLDAWLLSSNH